MLTVKTIKSTIYKTGQDQWFTGSNTAVVKCSLQPNKPVCNRPTKLLQWSDKSMVKALDMMASGKMGVDRAALKFGVPCITLKDRVAGRVTHGSNMGSKPYLNYTEEK